MGPDEHPIGRVPVERIAIRIPRRQIIAVDYARRPTKASLDVVLDEAIRHHLDLHVKLSELADREVRLVVRVEIASVQVPNEGVQIRGLIVPRIEAGANRDRLVPKRTLVDLRISRRLELVPEPDVVHAIPQELDIRLEVDVDPMSLRLLRIVGRGSKPSDRR